MSSLKYEITQIPISPVKIKNKKSTIMTQTVKEYRNDAIHFGEWCKKNRGIRHLDELCAQKVTLLQDYADDLAAQALIQAQIRRAVFVVLFHLVLLFSPSLDILICPEHCKLWVRKKQGEIYP